MKKNILAVIIFVFMGIHAANAYYVASIGHITNNDITAYINDIPIPSYNFRGMQVIFAEDLANYGFNVTWYERSSSLIIKRELNKAFLPVPEIPIEEIEVFSGYYTVFLGNRKIPSYSVNERSVIHFEDLKLFGEFIQSEKAVALKLHDDRLYDNGLEITLTSNSVTNESDESIQAVNLRAYYYNTEANQLLAFDERLTNAYSGNTINTKESSALINRYKEAPLYWLGTVILSIEKVGNIIPNILFDSDGEYIMDNNLKRTLEIFYWEKLVKKQKLSDERENNGNVPLAVFDYYISVGENGEKNACIKVKNLNEYPITSFNLNFFCVDWNGNPVKYNGTGWNMFSGNMTNGYIYPNEIKSYLWTLQGYDTIARIENIKVKSVTFDGASVWKGN